MCVFLCQRLLKCMSQKYRKCINIVYVCVCVSLVRVCVCVSTRSILSSTTDLQTLTFGIKLCREEEEKSSRLKKRIQTDQRPEQKKKEVSLLYSLIHCRPVDKAALGELDSAVRGERRGFPEQTSVSLRMDTHKL